MLPGETMGLGCPVGWPNREAPAAPLARLRSSNGDDIERRSPCSEIHSRGSDHGPTRLLGKATLAGGCSFGCGDRVHDTATCRPGQAQRSVTATSSLADQIWLQVKHTARRIARLLTRTPTTEVVKDDTSRPSRSRGFKVAVLHNRGRGRFFGYEAGDALVRVFDLSVSASGVEAACEVVFAITNSYPCELFCEPTYADVVAKYRAAGLRSLSVGDVLIIGDQTGVNTAWACAPAGFDQLDSVPAFANRYWPYAHPRVNDRRETRRPGHADSAGRGDWRR
jgi:hypothetical protein